MFCNCLPPVYDVRAVKLMRLIYNHMGHNKITKQRSGQGWLEPSPAQSNSTLRISNGRFLCRVEFPEFILLEGSARLEHRILKKSYIWGAIEGNKINFWAGQSCSWVARLPDANGTKAGRGEEAADLWSWPPRNSFFPSDIGGHRSFFFFFKEPQIIFAFPWNLTLFT